MAIRMGTTSDRPARRGHMADRRADGMMRSSAQRIAALETQLEAARREQVALRAAIADYEAQPDDRRDLLIQLRSDIADLVDRIERQGKAMARIIAQSGDVAPDLQQDSDQATPADRH